MKLIVAPKFVAVLEIQDGAKGDVTTAKAEIVTVSKKGVFITGEDGCHVPVTVQYTDGEEKLAVGDKVVFQVDGGLLVSRDAVKQTSPTPRRSGTGSPDSSFKSHGN